VQRANQTGRVDTSERAPSRSWFIVMMCTYISALYRHRGFWLTFDDGCQVASRSRLIVVSGGNNVLCLFSMGKMFFNILATFAESEADLSPCSDITS
jgi:hypothetical protein